ncbi:hypothetical protein ACFSJ3_06015 [Corallincola platygyrae]|uniref:Uncharacterized protein n=1 Tax=Corallincola platygyrae TaxID=1193278 RepID=A0ABW4XJ24_9GAMM
MSGYKKTLSPYQKQKYRSAIVGYAIAITSFLAAINGVLTIAMGFVSLYGLVTGSYSLLLARFNYDEEDADMVEQHTLRATVKTHSDSNKK